MLKIYYFAYLLCLVLISCNPAKQLNTTVQDDGKIEVVFIQINDVYEIAPLEGGKSGGMARVATLKKQLLTFNPNTILVHAGDFLSPSLIGTMKYEGSRIRGRQMVEAMNAAGVDLVTFGNHEFDIDEADLNQRMKESEFDWVSANVLNQKGEQLQAFNYGENPQAVKETYIHSFTDTDGTRVNIGFLSVTLDDNQVDYVKYEDFTQEAVKVYNQLKSETDVIVGLTHLEMQQDIALAPKIPDVPLIMGGHDHDHMIRKSGNTVIAKADANAKTAYLHRLLIDKNNGKVSLSSSLIYLNETIPLDEETNRVVQKWSVIADESFRAAGFDPNGVVAELEVALDGREKSIRHKQTNMGKIIAAAMAAAYRDEVDCAILNSGSIRIDDQVKGSITQYDIFRILPFGGAVLKVKMSGELLERILSFAWNRKGNGAFLQWHNISLKENQWFISGQLLEKSRNYDVAINDFLISGYDIPFFTKENEGIILVSEPDTKDKNELAGDIRRAVIAYLQKM